MKVYSKNEARDFFLSNSSGTVTAVDKDGNEKECDCYPDAVKHIEQN